MKKILIPCLLLITTIVQAQLNNSWIDYSKTYYKFRLGSTGLCRINQATLSAAGLGTVPADQFQLWRNGQQVPIYTSIAGGSFGSNDYIEFLGTGNDGKPDKNLYLDTSYQLSDAYSLFTDTVAYYLTVNSAGGNLRYTNTGNIIPATPPAPDAYFMRRVESAYRSQLNPGYAVYVTEPIYSSAFDMGEGWTSGSFGGCIGCAPNLSVTFDNLNVYANAPANSASCYISALSNTNVDYVNRRNLRVQLSGNILLDTTISGFSIVKRKINNLSLSLLQSATGAKVGVDIYNSSDYGNDQAVVATIALTYPSTFNFNNQSSFYFELAASATGNYLVINNFNNANSIPVLYDINNGLRYSGDISVGGTIRFALPASADNIRKFMLVSEDASNITAINTLSSRQFINYKNLIDSQGNYIIISNPLLYNDGSGNNNVEAYRAYRASANGGSYIAKTVSINELTDQFGFGIKNHPAAIRDFIMSTQLWTVKPKYIFIIGRGVAYSAARPNESAPNIGQMDFVPTFGYPASDVLLANPPTAYNPPGQVVPLVPIGRLPVINGKEIKSYLDKMIDYESAQASTNQTISNKGWMKNFVHISGGNDNNETGQFAGYLNGYGNIASNPLEGANVSTFLKSSTSYVEQLAGEQIQQLITSGVNFISYFGHASANTFAFNLADPSTYQNTGKYPFFNVSGCTAGDFYTYDPARLNNSLSISENWVFAPQSGSIGFLADTYLGIPNYLDYYNSAFYTNFSRTMYGNTVGNQLKQVDQTIGGNPSSLNSYGGFYMRTHLEEINLNGDPALKINSFALPDYVIETPQVKINPSVISVADGSFTVNIQMMNIGRAIDDSINVLVERQLPNDSIVVLYNKLIPAILYLDSLSFTIPINAVSDAGDNKIIVQLNNDGRVQELSTTNNSVAVDFTIYRDELNPVYPYNYSIVNQQGITYSASTASAISAVPRQYLMQIDTSALFNSPFMKQYPVTGAAGIIEFKAPDVVFKDSTVYYWRTSIVPLSSSTPTIWNSSSFVYLPNGGTGFNQSHYYQHLNSSYSSIELDADRVFRFKKTPTNLIITTGLYPYYAGDQISVDLGTLQLNQYGCKYNTLQVVVYDTITFTPWQNYTTNNSGRFGSWTTTCSNSPVRNFFEFPYNDPTYRENFIHFLDSIPQGMFVSISNLGATNNNGGIEVNNSFVNDWKTPDGSGNSLYSVLKSIGFTKIDSFTHNLPFVFYFKKGVSSFVPKQVIGPSEDTYIQDTIPVTTAVTSGTISSPLFGPAKTWTSLHWNGNAIDPGRGDSVQIQVYGVGSNGSGQTLLATVAPAKDTSLAFINAVQYPYIKLVMQNVDSAYATPNQLSFWRINASYVPEGAVAPNILYTMKDTLNQGQKIAFAMAFKNISSTAFDSLNVKFAITNANNVQDTFIIPKGKALVSGDTLVVRDTIDTKNLPGNNTLYVMVNPYNDQPEQYFFNNSITQNFYVIPDNTNPLLDVTFDGVHIMNKDLVSSKPHITIKLQDNNQFLALSDTSMIKVQVYFPDPSSLTSGTLVTYHFGDSMQFIPANLATGQNTATINLIGNFPVDGQYQLIVSGKDAKGNTAGELEYRVSFNVINKTMISNLFNYPNPFTTSTAFVFTLTGNQLPQNMRIQILTISGKVVREITQSELGPLHIGDNITQYKWNGTDMYGQKLANGVYLYRVLTNLNGKSIQKYNGASANGETITNGLNNTDQYFTKGYGKMYLIR